MIDETDGYPVITKAVAADIETVHKILNLFAEKGLLLPRSLSELYEHLRQYFVLKMDPGGAVLGVCGLGICWKDLAEIESLAIVEAHQGEIHLESSDETGTTFCIKLPLFNDAEKPLSSDLPPHARIAC